MTQTKRHLARAVAEQTDLTQVKALAATNAVLDAMAKALIEDQRLELRDFGVFEVAQHSKRKLKHPATGEPIQVPAQKIVHFRAGKALKQSLNDKLE